MMHTAGGIVIKDGRHPIMDSLGDYGAFVPNDTFLLGQHKLALVTGPNCAGKSTYLKQTALNCIMAQIGCYVPASSAQLPLVDRLFTRIGTEDSIECNASTFSLEMAESAASPRRLNAAIFTPLHTYTHTI